MTLFRLKNKKKLIRVVPTAFTPEVCRLFEYVPTCSAEADIVNEHNEEIRRILSEPK